jgi:hypothetical protein
MDTKTVVKSTWMPNLYMTDLLRSDKKTLGEILSLVPIQELDHFSN